MPAGGSAVTLTVRLPGCERSARHRRLIDQAQRPDLARPRESRDEWRRYCRQNQSADRPR
jgi:hypothetical protein